jgi:hypothetical protein
LEKLVGLTRLLGVSARYLLVSARRAGLSPKLLSNSRVLA